MSNKISSVTAMFLIFLCLNSLIYHQIEDLSDDLTRFSDNFPDVTEILDDSDDYVPNEYSPRIKTEVIEGNYTTRAFFSYDSFTPSLDVNGSGYQWTEYDDIPGHDATGLDTERFGVGDISNAVVPQINDVYYLARDYWGSGHRAMMYSPVLPYNTTVADKVHYIFNMHRDLNDNASDSQFNAMDATFQITLWHYHSSTQDSTKITSVEYLLPKINTPTDTEYWEWLETSSSFSSYTVPAGDRFKITYEMKYSDVSATLGHFTLNIINDGQYYDTGISGTSLDWNIIDGIHSNSYTISNTDGMLGIQLYMFEENTPDINLYNAVNNTVYQTTKNMTIDVSDDSISSYRWDGGSWNSFENDTIVYLPTTHGWHYLEIEAKGPVYNNTRIELYKFGYDSSVDNIILHNALSGDYLAGGYVLNFSIFDVDSVVYNWNWNGSWFTLTDPYDITTPQFLGWRDLIINTTDFYETNSYLYTFFFDSDTPIITLTNADNDTIYAPGKYLEFSITDNTGLISLNYSWDSGPIQTWSSDPSNTYSTNLPGSVADHWLEIFVSDDYGHFASAYFEFFTDTDIFNVDLLNLVEDNYYQGGNTVELIVQRSNTTVYFKWDSDSEQLGTLDGSYLTLNGSDALPSSEGLHTLYIRTFNLSYIEFNFNFSFWVDNTDPIIEYLDIYDGGRWFQNKTFTISIYDYYTDNSTELIVEYSLDGKIYQPLDYPFNFFYPYLDGPHTLDIRAQDLAGNVGNYTINFIIDNTAPTIDVTWGGLLDRILVDGYLYILPDSLIEVDIIEVDPTYRIEYNWNNTGWINATIGSFILTSSFDGEALLQIRANDSLGNKAEIFEILLVYDNTPPEISLTFPTTHFEINDHADLEFDVTDFTQYNTDSITYQWDDAIGIGTFDVADIESFLDGHFRLELGESARFLYVAYGYELANLSITAEDILGNSETYNFTFTIDVSPPSISLFINETVLTPISPGSVNIVQGGTSLWFNSSVDSDFYSFEYYWEFTPVDEGLSLYAPWTFEVPKADGNHSLKVTLGDYTGQGTSPNYISYNFTFIVDDITIEYLLPLDFDDGYKIDMEYNDTFIYVVNVTDANDNEPIPGLNYLIHYDDTYNLTIDVVSIGPSEYQVSILASDVTNGLETYVNIQFFQTVGGGQTIHFFPTIYKKEGEIILLETDNQIVHEEDLEIQLYLQNDLGENQTVSKVYVNDSYSQTLKEIIDFDFNVSTYICTFNYSSYEINLKGNYSLDISVESSFYFANTLASNETIDFEILPLGINMIITVSNYTILEGTDVSINLQLTYLNGTPVPFTDVIITIYVYLKNTTTESTFMFSFEDANGTEVFLLETNSQGRASMLFNLNSTVDNIVIEGSYLGGDTTDSVTFSLEEPIVTIPIPEAEEFPKWLLYTLIAGSIALAAIVSLIIYKVTRPKPFEVLMEKITDEEIALNYSIMSPGVVLTIFDQRKGPIPLVADHSLTIGRYIGRMTIGVENFMLKIADQAYSSLGFEEHDAGRRVGSIVLPTEKMIGFVHGVQLPNKMARGGFENLSLIVLADSEYGNLLLNYQEHIYEEVDSLIKLLKDKKPLKEVEIKLESIRKLSVVIMLSAQKAEPKEKNGR